MLLKKVKKKCTSSNFFEKTLYKQWPDIAGVDKNYTNIYFC